MGVGDVAKRVLLGRKLRSTQREALLPKRIALPVFASDALSSVAYATDEIFIMLSVAGVTAYAWSWQVAILVSLVMLTVVASYRQTVRAYPSGGGDYEVAKVNLGPRAGITVASALMFDYVMTVAVSVSALMQNAAAAAPFLSGNEAFTASLVVLFLVALNLRGVRESQIAFAVPAYFFMVAVLAMAVWGFTRELTGTLTPAESASFTVLKADGYEGTITNVALFLLVARAFSSGCVALTGIEAVSTGVPAFRRPKSRNAAATLLMLGLLAVAMIMSVVALANLMGVRYVDPHDRERLVRPDGQPLPADHDQNTVISQIARGVFENFPPGFYVVIAAVVLILLVAANTAFNSFPVLGSILARDGYAPRALGSRGDRLAYSNGILVLGAAAIVLILSFDAEITRLIQLYIVGVFVSFTLGQLGMLRHWSRELRTAGPGPERRRMLRSRAINAFGLGMTMIVLVVVLITKFLAGAWIALLAMGTFFVLMRGIKSHYDRVGQELTIEEEDQTLPTRVHAIVLVSKLHKPTMRALAYAKAARPNTLEAVMVDTDAATTARVLEEWDERRIDIPLKVLYSPYREIIKPVVDYSRSIRDANPRGVVAVYIPEYVVGHWWEQLLHNQTALRLKGRLLFTQGVMVTSVPYQLRSSEVAKERAERAREQVRPGDLRRGRTATGSRGRDREDT